MRTFFLNLFFHPENLTGWQVFLEPFRFIFIFLFLGAAFLYLLKRIFGMKLGFGKIIRYFCFLIIFGWALPFLIPYWLVRRLFGYSRHKPDPEKHLKRYEKNCERYYHGKEICVDMLKAHGVFLGLFIAGTLLILFSTALRPATMPDNTADLLFVIGFLMDLVVLGRFFLEFLMEGGGKLFADVSSTLHQKYLEPEYVTETVYEKWDDEPDSMWKEKSSRTFNKNESHNIFAFLMNIFYGFAKVCYAIAFSVFYTVDILLQVVFHLILLGLAHPIYRVFAKRNYRKFIKSVARTSNPTFPYMMYVSGSRYNEISGKIVEQFVQASTKAEKEGKSRFLLCVRNTQDDSCFVSFVKKNLGTVSMENGFACIYENKTHRVTVATRVYPEGNSVTYPSILPIYAEENWAPELYDEDNLALMQYPFVKLAVEFLPKSKKVILQRYDYSAAKILPVRVKPMDIEFHEQAPYALKSYTPCKKPRPSLRRFLVTLLSIAAGLCGLAYAALAYVAFRLRLSIGETVAYLKQVFSSPKAKVELESLKAFFFELINEDPSFFFLMLICLLMLPLCLSLIAKEKSNRR